MNSRRTFLLAVTLILSAQSASAQEMHQYRAYALESSLDSVIAATGARATEAKTLFQRPAVIQELQWRAPYGAAGAGLTHADPVRHVTFTFYNQALYQVVVTYDRDRTEGLTDADVVEVLSTAYGVPALASARTGTLPPAEVSSESVVLARWETGESLVTLVRGGQRPEFQLILVSKSMSSQARNAIREARRLDTLEAPRRESDQRKKEAADAVVALQNTRVTNKAAFRP